MYVRHVRHHNGGVMFGGPGGGLGRRYEIQLMDVEGAHYATGSIPSPPYKATTKLRKLSRLVSHLPDFDALRTASEPRAAASEPMSQSSFT